jgi:hypothetical protein
VVSRGRAAMPHTKRGAPIGETRDGVWMLNLLVRFCLSICVRWRGVVGVGGSIRAVLEVAFVAGEA